MKMTTENKRIMLLGGNYFQMTATKAAKRLGCYVISVDYLPDNPAHKFADEYHNVSTVDKDAVLQLARQLNIDGIVSYASDVSAPTAAYVAERLGLPTNPYDSVNILTHKDLMRPFLERNGFNVPKGKGFTDKGEARAFFDSIRKPAMIKPVDASGSKGVSKLESGDGFDEAFEDAMHYSLSKHIIIEEFIQRANYQVAGDGFLVDGELRFFGLMNEHFNKPEICNPLVPIGESYPAVLPKHLREKAKSEIQRLMTLLGMKNGAINLDFMFDENEELYIIEIGPRNGGNLITDAIKEACGVDLAEYTIKSALGVDCSDLCEQPLRQYVSSFVIHSLKSGELDSLRVSGSLKDDILLCDMFEQPGAHVEPFNNGAFGLGAMLIRHGSSEEMLERMDNMEEYVEIVTK